MIGGVTPDARSATVAADAADFFSVPAVDAGAVEKPYLTYFPQLSNVAALFGNADGITVGDGPMGTQFAKVPLGGAAALQVFRHMDGEGVTYQAFDGAGRLVASRTADSETSGVIPAISISVQDHGMDKTATVYTNGAVVIA
jgi:hypothetical protein